MSKLLYTVKDLFSKDSQNGCLGINGATGYYIAPYQRGYKWQSSDVWNSPDQVNTLLRDVYDAWKRNPESTYYLQFITVKRAVDPENRTVLEVIDGQQRLTTLSILAAVFHDEYSFDDFAGDTIGYYSRTDGRTSESKSKKCLSGFHTGQPDPKEDEIDDQTVWFMLRARNNIKSLLELQWPGDAAQNLEPFFNYLCDKTQIIVNLVQNTISSEKIFENLNGRKVLLTDSELVKGLLLCQAARTSSPVSYPEILDRRTDMGRTWDEMERWLSSEKVAPYFFGDMNYATYDFLLLVLLQNGWSPQEEESGNLYLAREEQSPASTKRYRLFNKFYEHISSAEDALAIFRCIEDTYWRMRDAFEDVERHNAFGFLLFRKKGVERLQLIGTLTKLGNNWRPETMRKIKEGAKSRAENLDSPEAFYASYRYDYNSPESIRQDLLMVNCFMLGKDDSFMGNDKLPFPFYGLSEEDTKSLEHVQCQKPIGYNGEDCETMVKKLKERKKDIQDWFFTIRAANRIMHCDQYSDEAEQIRKLLNNEKDAVKLAEELENGEDPDTEEKWEQVADFYLRLAEIHYARFELRLCKLAPGQFAGVETSLWHSIGNLVLVTGPLNSAFNNRVFSEKRRVLRDKINEGETVPPHTFNVFSKMNGMGGYADCWCAEDALANAEETLLLLYKLRKALESFDSNEGGKK